MSAPPIIVTSVPWACWRRMVDVNHVKVNRIVMQTSQKSVGIAGLGAVGMACVRELEAGIEGLSLGAVSARDLERAKDRVLACTAHSVPVVPAEALAEHAEIIVECAPASAFRQIAEPCLRKGKTLVAISVGALLDAWDLVELARQSGGRIILPTGALLGLDAVQAAARGHIERVTMVTTKPPSGLAGAPHLVDNNIDLSALTEPRLVFKGTAREGARAFPANVNVAAALGLAGVGPDKTELEVWADPDIRRNRHRIVVESDSANMEFVIENVPSDANPRTGKIVAQSVLATLEKLVSPLAVGT